MRPSQPQISVVVNILLGGGYTERCIDALLHQEGAPVPEVVVPVCPGIDDVERLRRRYPGVLFPAVAVPPGADPAHPGLAHLIYNRKRAAGLAAATRGIVALTEDQIVPDPDWCAAITRAHATFPHGAIGGAVENCGSGMLHRALYLCDFGRYGLPFAAGPSPFLTDQNVSYKRAALERVRESWIEAYDEPTVHGAMVTSGETLWLTPECVVRMDRGGLSLPRQLRERWAWGRVYGGTRARQSPALRRAILLLASPVIPLLIAWRLLSGRRSREAWSALPAILPLALAWAAGEAAGYVTARPFPVAD